MKSEIFWPLLIMLILTAITVFGLLPLGAAPVPKAKMPAAKKPIIVTRPIVRLGDPYRAELHRKDKH